MNNILEVARGVLATTPFRWESLVQALPVELLNRQPAVGQWSALECLQHLLDTEPIFSARIGYFLGGQDFPAFDPDTQGTPLSARSAPQEMAARFTRLRKDSLASLARVAPKDLDRRVRHAELGPVTLGEMVHEWAAHDFNHTVQAERALMQPFILGSGPWEFYFKDHLVQQK
ncbi:MAG TPA: DinB family protein [Anaerolineaceae bacterium]|nr:DinB family protein [Anaerolineaceae bacterium]